MSKREFEKKVKEEIEKSGCKVVDMNTIKLDATFSNAKLFDTFVIAIRNHVVYKYRAYQNESITTISVNYVGVLGL